MFLSRPYTPENFQTEVVHSTFLNHRTHTSVLDVFILKYWSQIVLFSVELTVAAEPFLGCKQSQAPLLNGGLMLISSLLFMIICQSSALLYIDFPLNIVCWFPCSCNRGNPIVLPEWKDQPTGCCCGLRNAKCAQSSQSLEEAPFLFPLPWFP